jgi:hypothetical protein
MKHKVLRTKNHTISISGHPYVGICMRREVMCDLHPNQSLLDTSEGLTILAQVFNTMISPGSGAAAA